MGTLTAGENLKVLTVGPASYSVREVIDAAFFRGELQPAWLALLQMIACEKHAGDEGREADDSAVDSAAQTFRYDHDLITAEETERWLAERGLTLSDFSDYFVRHYWRETLGEMRGEQVSLHAAPSEMRELLVAELMLSGEMARFAKQLSWRLAAAAASDGTEPSVEETYATREEFVERLHPMGFAEWKVSAGLDDEWVNRMAVLEANFRIHCEGILTPQARQRELATLRLQLTVFELEVIELDSRDAAQEALLCVRDDEMSMEQVAAEGRYPFRREERLLEDIPPDVQQRFLSASAGDLMPPMELDGGYRLCRISGKREPDPADPSVRSRVDQRLLDRHFTELASRHVRWDLALS